MYPDDLPFKCIQIAGTNGKGSTAAYIGGILRAGGRRCGVFTSPHVVSPSERIAVDGKDIPEEELAKLLHKYREAPTFFHAYTYAAFDWFNRQRVEYAVVETGLGGRLDPTTELNPEVCVFTSFGLDHMQVLGDTIEKITLEKCGILKNGAMAVTGPQREEAKAVLRAQCAEKNCALTELIPEDIRIIKRELSGQWFDLRYEGRWIEGLHTVMLGLKQPENASLAAAACLMCGIGESAVKKGLKSARIASRFSYIPGTPPMVLDGAHNVDSARELAAALAYYFPEKPVVLLAAVMGDKDIEGIFKHFSGFAGYAFTVKADETRGAPAETLAGVLKAYGVPAEPFSDVREAFQKAAEKAVRQDALLVVSGSFYLTGKVLKMLGTQ